MSEDDAGRELEQRFLKGIENDPFAERDEDLLRDTLRIFVAGALDRAEGDSAFDKAALAIAMHFMMGPKSDKDLRVYFPDIHEGRYAESQKQQDRKAIAREVRGLIKEGRRVTHAIAAVAAKRNKSPQKVTKDYYDWNSYWEEHDASVEMFKRKIDGEQIH